MEEKERSNKMQLGIRIHDLAQLPLEERIAQIHSLGFTCGHLALSKVISEFPTEDEALPPGLAMYLKNLFAKNQVDIAVLGCYLNLADPDEERIARITRRYMAHIRFASWLGCGVVGTETGAPNSAYAFTPECHTEEALGIFIDHLRPVVEYAEKMGVVVAIEPVYRHIVWNPVRARRVLDEIGSPNLQIIFDPVNLLDVPNYAQREAVIEEAVELLGPDIAVVHLKDCALRGGKLLSMGCGLGEMNYSPILKFMKERKPFIQATLEDTKPENNQRVKHYIQRMYEEA